jgi:uncharacterized protein (DUF4415 family)
MYKITTPVFSSHRTSFPLPKGQNVRQKISISSQNERALNKNEYCQHQSIRWSHVYIRKKNNGKPKIADSQALVTQRLHGRVLKVDAYEPDGKSS